MRLKTESLPDRTQFQNPQQPATKRFLLYRTSVGRAHNLFWPFGTVTTACLHTLGDTQGIQNTADNFVANPWQVANTTTANKNNRVFLKIVTFTGDVSRDFFTVGKTNTSYFSQSRVRLFRSYRFHQQTDAAFLRTAFQHRSLGANGLMLPRFPNQLIDRRHSFTCVWSIVTNPEQPSNAMERNPELEECKCQSRELQALHRRVVSSSLNFFVFSISLIFRRRKSLLTLRRQKNLRVTRISESPNQVSRSQVRHISRYFALNRRSKLFSNEPGIVEATWRNCNAQISILGSRDIKWNVWTVISIRGHFYASQETNGKSFKISC